MKKLASLSFLMAAALLSGCAPQPTVMPDGRRGLSVDCSGSYLSWQTCYQQAGDACPRGYEIISKDTDTNANFMADRKTAIGEMESTRTMMIVCK